MRVDGALVCPLYIGRLVGRIFHRREQLSGHVSVCRGGKSRTEYEEDEGVEIQISFELGFAAMRVVLRSLIGIILMEMPAPSTRCS